MVRILSSFCIANNILKIVITCYIDGIQYGGATVAFLGPTHRFLCSHGVYARDSDVLMF